MQRARLTWWSHLPLKYLGIIMATGTKAIQARIMRTACARSRPSPEVSTAEKESKEMGDAEAIWNL